MSKKNQILLNCNYCDVQIKRSLSSIRKNNFCTKNHAYLWRRGRKTQPCKEETKVKIRKSNKGKVPSLATLQKAWEARRGQPSWNRKEYNYKPYFCDCGCMEICSHGKRYISGHNFLGKNSEFNPWKKYKNYHKNGNPGSEKIRELWADPFWAKIQIKKIFDSCNRKPNSKEIFLNEIIQNERPDEFEYTGNGKVIIEGKCPDWVNKNGKKQIIELFGIYWHKPEDEEIRKSYFSKYGYSVLVIWENELEDIENLKKKLRNFI